MGNSDQSYFRWLVGALKRSGIGASSELVVLGGMRRNPAIDYLQPNYIRFLDRFAKGPDVECIDFNHLESMSSHMTDMIMMTRASYLIADLHAFFFHTHRMLRANGMMIIDWVRGSAEAPCDGIRGSHVYDGVQYPFRMMWPDDQALAPFYKVNYREQRNLYRETGKHFTYLLTVLTKEPEV